MRAYFIQNMYLQGIHAGIQSQHTTAELFVKYKYSHGYRHKVLMDWAENHKTTIVLNGGYASVLREWVEFLESIDEEFSLPWAYFEEGEDALEGCITNVGIIIPEEIYAAMRCTNKVTYEVTYEYERPDGSIKQLEGWKHDLRSRLDRHRLMS